VTLLFDEESYTYMPVDPGWPMALLPVYEPLLLALA
jgi:hypothetical protein